MYLGWASCHGNACRPLHGHSAHIQGVNIRLLNNTLLSCIILWCVKPTACRWHRHICNSALPSSCRNWHHPQHAVSNWGLAHWKSTNQQCQCSKSQNHLVGNQATAGGQVRSALFHSAFHTGSRLWCDCVYLAGHTTTCMSFAALSLLVQAAVQSAPMSSVIWWTLERVSLSFKGLFTAPTKWCLFSVSPTAETCLFPRLLRNRSTSKYELEGALYKLWLID